MKPILKWAGGKTRLLPELIKRMPAKYKRYMEPFAGGAALFFALDHGVKPTLLNDYNFEIKTLYSVLQDDVTRERLGRKLETMLPANEQYFYQIRGLLGPTMPDVDRAARFLFLNRTCFNGLYRENSHGQFNVPWGKYKNPKIFSWGQFAEAGLKLRNTVISGTDFRMFCMHHAKRDDFIYFDPPYVDTFTNYTAKGFNLKDQDQLAGLFWELDKSGVKMMLSNSDHPIVHELYKDFNIEKVAVRSSISAGPGGRGSRAEVIVRNYA